MPYAIEGESIFAQTHAIFGELQLIVVGEFGARQDQTRMTVSQILETHQVRMVADDQLDALVQEIMARGKTISA